MKPQRTLYGVISILLAAFLIMSSVAAYYFYLYNNAQDGENSYLSQLSASQASYKDSVAKYNALVSGYGQIQSNYNSSLKLLQQLIPIYNASVAQFNQLSKTYSGLLSQYNTTMGLLTRSVASLNTSTPAYADASRSLPSLWARYSVLAKEYASEVRSFDDTYASFQSLLPMYQSMTHSSPKLLSPVQPETLNLPAANILFDFGNGTRRWYNNTAFQPGWNLYIVTLVLTNGNMKSTWYPAYGAHFITGIDGVSSTSTKFWFLWTRNGTAWQVAQTGADGYLMANGETFAWTFCGATPEFAPLCTPT